ncbi:hypothetical protein GGR57DRAFT_351029 [Xylariaceae sp. FL1272]|nr:hypothetical protein GGR57DRAFT_351029 [Xylariaceae sp. FL1272]
MSHIMSRRLRTFRICLPSANKNVWGPVPQALPSGRHASCRFYSAAVKMPSARMPAASAVVVGAGPGGITVVGNLLEYDSELQTGKQPLVWVDPHFNGGRVNDRYREVPSNTKVNLFVQFANEVSAFKTVLKTTPKPNAITALEELPQDKGCRLSHAADMCLMLTDGLAKDRRIQQEKSNVASATLDEQRNVWMVTLDSGETFESSKLALCTGSTPVSTIIPAIEKISTPMISVDLDTALAPSKLSKTFSGTEPCTVAVVGASHSAILVLMNLVALAQSSHPHLRIKWFTRNKLRYAEYMDGWILRDNTGLKGQAADWARENLDENTFSKSLVSDHITKVWTAGRENEAYEAELPECTHIVQAVGYARNPLPRLEIAPKSGGPTKPLEVEYDNMSGRFFDKAGSKQEHIPGLFGAGIAFPERVTDPHGNVEYAVGFWKFMKFIKKVVPNWVSGS